MVRPTRGRGNRTREQRLRVARAGLSGLQRRLSNIDVRRDLTPEQKTQLRAETVLEIAERRQRITSLGGDPDDDSS